MSKTNVIVKQILIDIYRPWYEFNESFMKTNKINSSIYQLDMPIFKDVYEAMISTKMMITEVYHLPYLTL
jgi:hypothetical protein